MTETAGCIKFLVAEAGNDAAVRVFTGPDYDSMQYSGSLVIPVPLLGRMLDSLIYGAGDLGGVQVFYDIDNIADVEEP